MTKSKKNDLSSPERIERRRAKRRPFLETFSIFLSIPKKGLHRLQIHDISELGIKFDLDTEGESQSDYPIRTGDTIDLRFYLNTSLFFPLSIQVVRVEESHLVRRVGASFQDITSKNYRALLSLIELLDGIVDIVELDPNSGSI